jgi:hypothetical protein
MNITSNNRFRRTILFFAVLTFLATVAYAGELSNKWRIKVNHDAKSDCTMVFRVSPKDQTAIDVTAQ